MNWVIVLLLVIVTLQLTLIGLIYHVGEAINHAVAILRRERLD
jgi:hypothetical protein